MAVSLKPLGSNVNPEDLVAIIREVLSDLEDQLNTRAQVYSSTSGTIPAGLNRGDVFVLDFKGRISVLVKNARGFDTLTAEMIGGMPSTNTQFLGFKSGTAAPVVADFPAANDWGFFAKTTVVTAFYLCYNQAGTLKKVALT